MLRAGFELEICRQRLTPAHFNRAVVLAETFTPADAVAAGFLDQAVEASSVHEAARGVAAQLATLDLSALREHVLEAALALLAAEGCRGSRRGRSLRRRGLRHPRCMSCSGIRAAFVPCSTGCSPHERNGRSRPSGESSALPRPPRSPRSTRGLTRSSAW
jgi:enoyl-CoA hydratase/carnithine racemase